MDLLKGALKVARTAIWSTAGLTALVAYGLCDQAGAEDLAKLAERAGWASLEKLGDMWLPDVPNSESIDTIQAEEPNEQVQETNLENDSEEIVATDQDCNWRDTE